MSKNLSHLPMGQVPFDLSPRDRGQVTPKMPIFPAQTCPLSHGTGCPRLSPAHLSPVPPLYRGGTGQGQGCPGTGSPPSTQEQM